MKYFLTLLFVFSVLAKEEEVPLTLHKYKFYYGIRSGQYSDTYTIDGDLLAHTFYHPTSHHFLKVSAVSVIGTELIHPKEYLIPANINAIFIFDKSNQTNEFANISTLGNLYIERKTVTHKFDLRVD